MNFLKPVTIQFDRGGFGIGISLVGAPIRKDEADCLRYAIIWSPQKVSGQGATRIDGSQMGLRAVSNPSRIITASRNETECSGQDSRRRTAAADSKISQSKLTKHE